MPTDLVGLNLLTFYSAQSQRLQGFHGPCLGSGGDVAHDQHHETVFRKQVHGHFPVLLGLVGGGRKIAGSGEAHAEENKTVPAHDVHGAFFTFCVRVINQSKIVLAEIVRFQ